MPVAETLTFWLTVYKKEGIHTVDSHYHELAKETKTVSTKQDFRERGVTFINYVFPNKY